MKGRPSRMKPCDGPGPWGFGPFAMGQGTRGGGRRQVSGIRLGLGGAPCCTSPSCWEALRPGRLADAAGLVLSSCHRGDVAQLGERGVRNAEVGSSILLVSTIPIPRPTRHKVGRFCWQVAGLMTQMERGGRFIRGNYSEFPNSCGGGGQRRAWKPSSGWRSPRHAGCVCGAYWLFGPGCWRLIRDYRI